MKQVEVSILGQVYRLGCPDGGESLLAAAVASVDREMTSIRDSGKVRARERIAVLGRLAATVAHEVRNPLAGMLTCIDTIRHYGASEDVRQRSLDLVERGLHQIEAAPVADRGEGVGAGHGRRGLPGPHQVAPERDEEGHRPPEEQHEGHEQQEAVDAREGAAEVRG